MTREEPLSIQSCPLGNTLCGVTCHPVCRITKCTAGTALGPAPAKRMSAASSPCVPQALFLQKAHSADPQNSGPRSTKQVCTWTSHRSYGGSPALPPCTRTQKPTDTKTGSIPATVAPMSTQISHTPWSLQSQRQYDIPSYRERFPQTSFLRTGPWGSAMVSTLLLQSCRQPTNALCPEPA